MNALQISYFEQDRFVLKIAQKYAITRLENFVFTLFPI